MVWQVVSAAFGLLFLLSFPLLLWLIRYGSGGRNSPAVLLYHKIDRRPELGGTWNLPSQFENHMAYLKKRRFQVVPLEEVLARSQDGRRVSVTFDDGYEGIYQYAFPTLKRLGFPAAVFLIAAYIGDENLWDVTLGRRFRHLTWDQILEMRESGIAFGSHTMTHPDLTRIPPEEVRHELEASKELLEARLGEEVKFLSYPFGRYNREIQRIARNAGYEACFCSYPRGDNPGLDRYSVGRRGMYIVDTLFDFRAKVGPASLFSFGLEDIKGRTINAFSHGTPVAKRVFSRASSFEREPAWPT